jgi:dTDP-4-dehydrorhamnose reductase
MIWVTGSKGMLGREVTRAVDRLGRVHVDTDMDCDITDAAAVDRFVAGRPIEWIVNCSAYTAVDAAEAEEEKAAAVNAKGPANLGKVATRLRAKILHISTDYVFGGDASSPYGEEERPAPRSAYGRTKAKGEALLASANPRHFILRTAWLYGVHGKNFVTTMLRLMSERDEVSVVDDQHGTPTYAVDLASAICAIIDADSDNFGFYHYTNEGQTTWYHFAGAIQEMGLQLGLLKKQCRMVPTTTDRYPTKAIRPRYSVLSKKKISSTFGLAIPSWRNGLERYLQELVGEGRS